MTIPTMNTIQSSSISEIGHDGNHMFVRFVPTKGAAKGKLYRYVAVPSYVWLAVSEEINAGGSAGKIINSRIVKGGYSYEIVHEGELPLEPKQ